MSSYGQKRGKQKRKANLTSSEILFSEAMSCLPNVMTSGEVDVKFVRGVPDKFWLAMPTQVSKLNQYLKKIYDPFKKYQMWEKDVTELRVGDRVVAAKDKDNPATEFLRAEVIEIWDTDTPMKTRAFTLLLIDHGNELNVPGSALYLWEPLLDSLPPQAFSCKFVHTPQQTRLTTEDIFIFNSLLKKERLTAIIHSKTAGPKSLFEVGLRTKTSFEDVISILRSCVPNFDAGSNYQPWISPYNSRRLEMEFNEVYDNLERKNDEPWSTTGIKKDSKVWKWLTAYNHHLTNNPETDVEVSDVGGYLSDNEGNDLPYQPSTCSTRGFPTSKQSRHKKGRKNTKPKALSQDFSSNSSDQGSVSAPRLPNEKMVKECVAKLDFDTDCEVKEEGIEVKKARKTFLQEVSSLGTVEDNEFFGSTTTDETVYNRKTDGEQAIQQLHANSEIVCRSSVFIEREVELAELLEVRPDGELQFQFRLAHVKSLAEIYVLPISPMLWSVELITEKLSSVRLGRPSEHHDFEVGSCWALRVNEFNIRIRLEAKNKNDLWTVQAIDHGFRMNDVKSSDLRWLTEDQASSLPGLAVNCRLENIINLPDSLNCCINYINNVCCGKDKCLGVLKEVTETHIGIDIKVEKANGDTVDLGSTLVSMGLCRFLYPPRDDGMKLTSEEFEKSSDSDSASSNASQFGARWRQRDDDVEEALFGYQSQSHVCKSLLLYNHCPRGHLCQFPHTLPGHATHTMDKEAVPSLNTITADQEILVKLSVHRRSKNDNPSKFMFVPDILMSEHLMEISDDFTIEKLSKVMEREFISFPRNFTTDFYCSQMVAFKDKRLGVVRCIYAENITDSSDDEIIEALKKDRGSVNVYLIDYGISRLVDPLQLKMLPEKFASIPAQANFGTLSNYVPFEGTQWCKEACDAFFSLCTEFQKYLYGKVCKDGDMYKVDLFTKPETDYPHRIGEMLAKKRLARGIIREGWRR